MKTPTTLTFWTWAPDIAKQVAIFEQQYPAIKINVVNPGQGTPLYTKLRTALDAGKGTPDLSQVEQVPAHGGTASKARPPPFDTSVAHQARMYDHLLGGCFR
jgi:ABC-type glycerol-3-phosphate transport system substrate-binding protein